MTNYWLNALWSLTPTIAIGICFFTILWAILNADKKTREVYEQEKQRYIKNMSQQPPDETSSAKDPSASQYPLKNNPKSATKA